LESFSDAITAYEKVLEYDKQDPQALDGVVNSLLFLVNSYEFHEPNTMAFLTLLHRAKLMPHKKKPKNLSKFIQIVTRPGHHSQQFASPQEPKKMP